jgi:hypothetical protein
MEDWDRGIPWRQGDVFAPETASQLGLVLPVARDQTLVVVISHDCDLIQPPKKEPVVEVIVGRRIPKPDGNFTFAKNPRTLHLPLEENGAQIYIELHAKDKRCIQKTDLKNHKPNPAIAIVPNNRSVLQQWLAERYRRTALPDELERRLRERRFHEEVKRIVAPHGSHLIAILLDVDDGQSVEREAGENYILSIFVLYSTEKDPLEAEKVAGCVARALEDAARKRWYDEKRGWQGIELRECQAVSDSVLPYAAGMRLARLNFDYISLRLGD